MTKTSSKKRAAPGFRLVLLILLAALAAGAVWLRASQAKELSARTAQLPPESPQLSVPAPTAPPVEPKSSPTPAPAPAIPVESPVSEAAAATPVPERFYTQRSYDLVSEMVYTYRYQQEAGAEDIQRLLAELKTADPDLGTAWEGIMDAWSYVNTDLVLNKDVLPDGLPQDDSLCIVVLGFQLLPDGTMDPELLGRCQVALASAEKYPHAYLALTGGGTALGNPDATEAEVMADWFLSRGVDADRIILENRSLTTAENASFTCAVLAAQYPQVRQLAIVTSSYHVPLGTLLFVEEALLYEYENGLRPYSVISNASFAAPSRPDYEGTTKQAQYLWNLADPHY